MKKVLSIISLGAMLSASELSVETIGLNLGVANSSYSQKNHAGSIILGNQPDKSYNSFELYTTLNGVCEEEDMKPYISYTYSKNSDLKHQYLLVGVNKYYDYKKTTLYAGLLAGYGQLDWQYNPLNNSKDNNIDANSLIGGIQLGFNYPINKTISLGLNGKILVHDYETKLKPSDDVSSSIEHDTTTILSFGINYKF